jgi:hypothetical protein
MVQYVENGFVDEVTGDYHIGGMWYFWDESMSHIYGPYETREDAEDVEEFYHKVYLGD